MKHRHFNPGRLTFGCPACVERVKLDQDVAAAAELDIPPRRAFDPKQVEKCCRAAAAASHDEEQYWEWMDRWSNVRPITLDVYEFALPYLEAR